MPVDGAATVGETDILIEIGNPLDPKQAWEIAESLLGRAPSRLDPYRPAAGGDDSFSFRMYTAGQELLLKVKKKPGTPIGVYFHGCLEEAGVPVPKLVAFSPDRGPEGQACAVWSWVDGQAAEWDVGEPCPYDEGAFGALLRRIHELRFDGAFGLLGDNLASRTFASHPDLGPVSRTWMGFFRCDRAASRYFDRGVLSRREADALCRLPDTLDPLFAGMDARLLHLGDIMHNGNMIVRPDRSIAAVVDYVEATAGDPRWELAWVDYYFVDYPFERRQFDLRRFRAGYGTDHNPYDEVGRFYLLAVLLFEKLLFMKPDSDRGRWAIETAKEIIGRYL